MNSKTFSTYYAYYWEVVAKAKKFQGFMSAGPPVLVHNEVNSLGRSQKNYRFNGIMYARKINNINISLTEKFH